MRDISLNFGPIHTPSRRVLTTLPNMQSPRSIFLLCSAVSLLCRTASAHFPFLVPDRGGATATLIMSETLKPDDRVELSLLKHARLVVRSADGSESPLAAPDASHDGASLQLAVAGGGTRVLAGHIDLGIMQRGTGPAHVLVYYPKTIIGDPFDPSTRLQGRAPIEIVAERTDRGVVLRLLVDDAPVAGSAMHVLGPDGSDVEMTTDAEGRTPVLPSAGRYGAWARHWKDEEGERDDRAYVQVRRYATLVIDTPEASRGAVSVATLPRPVASFGAAVLDGALYVYGGHTGARHDYSTATVSGRFSRLDLSAPPTSDVRWQELPGGVAAQGLNIVAHRDSILRVGGMEPRNGVGQPADNHSLADVAAYRTGSGGWESLQPLPEPRSSHDVVVVGDTLVVVGGWRMHGAGTTPTWPDATLLLDLTSQGSDWERVPQPFQRRALIAAVLEKDVFVIGGFDEHDTPRLDVDVLDLRTRAWRSGPPIPGSPRNGFAPAACVHEGRLYVSVATGEIFRLSEDRATWELFAQATPRIVHRLVAWGDEILIVGGAREAAMTDLIESVAVHGGPATPRMGELAVAKQRWTHPDAERVEALMGMVDDAFETLVRIEASGWSAPTGEPGLVAVKEVDRLLVHLAEVPAEAASVPDGFRSLLEANAERAGRLKKLLQNPDADPVALSAQFAELRASCTECHRAYR